MSCDGHVTSHDSFVQSIMVDIIDIYTDMVNCALFPDAYESLSETNSQKLGVWNGFDDDTLETSGVWLPQTVRRIRYCRSPGFVSCRATDACLQGVCEFRGGPVSAGEGGDHVAQPSHECAVLVCRHLVPESFQR